MYSSSRVGDATATVASTPEVSEQHRLEKGMLATFNGENSISVVAGEKGALFTVALLKD